MEAQRSPVEAVIAEHGGTILETFVEVKTVQGGGTAEEYARMHLGRIVRGRGGDAERDAKGGFKR